MVTHTCTCRPTLTSSGGPVSMSLNSQLDGPGSILALVRLNFWILYTGYVQKRLVFRMGRKTEVRRVLKWSAR